MAMHRFELDPEALVEEIGTLTAEELDGLPFGAIQLDEGGTILSYNKTEEGISGRKAADVVGRNFFRDVAPCTQVKSFFGTFQSGVERRQLNEVFDFEFRFPTGTREVRIRMVYRAPVIWIFVTPLDVFISISDTRS